jgi:hypothetical protein
VIGLRVIDLRAGIGLIAFRPFLRSCHAVLSADGALVPSLTPHCVPAAKLLAVWQGSGTQELIGGITGPAPLERNQFNGTAPATPPDSCGDRR